ncbi:MAG: hypothetical protein AAGI53_16560 [Planctomycetota bacterium]
MTNDTPIAPPTEVVKFGSSVLRTDADVPRTATEIKRRVLSGARVVAVISAFRGRTDELVSLANRVGGRTRSRSALLALGELESATAVAIALERLGLNVELIAGDRCIVATGDPEESEPVGVDTGEIAAALGAGRVVVVPGYGARDPSGAAVVLGRGGSDLTAITLASALNARAVLLKATGAVFEWDPGEQGPTPGRFEWLSFEDALSLGDRVLQPRAVEYARRVRTPFEVSGLGTTTTSSTLVHDGPTRVRDDIEQSHR